MILKKLVVKLKATKYGVKMKKSEKFLEIITRPIAWLVGLLFKSIEVFEK
ncbi:hypothetical protein LCGC14_1783200 [marine sediment metagenome]|uniref:Uncharacterized protein n=1 Tax=marine sediment metagenome TaxID=412755 RepID=A0A0F9JUC9_9ZZZZ